MGQRLEQRIADPLRQFKGLTIQPSGTPEVAVGNGQVRQCREAHQALSIAFGRQALQRFGAIEQRQLPIASPSGNDAAQGQPLRKHGFFCAVADGAGRKRLKWLASSSAASNWQASPNAQL